MHATVIGFVALALGAVWLVLLLATDFNALIIGAGLLGVLSITGRASGSAPHHPGTGSRRRH